MHILTIRDSYYSFFDACDFLDPYYEVYTINLVSFYTIHVLNNPQLYTLLHTSFNEITQMLLVTDQVGPLTFNCTRFGIF